MPTYDYACERCGPFEALRSIAERERPVACPECGEPAPRVLGGPARLAAGRGGPIDLRDRAADGRYLRMRHPRACGCCR